MDTGSDRAAEDTVIISEGLFSLPRRICNSKDSRMDTSVLLFYHSPNTFLLQTECGPQALDRGPLQEFKFQSALTGRDI